MYRIETSTGEILAENVSRKELRNITSNSSIIIEVFDQNTGDYMGEFDPAEEGNK